MKAKDFRTFCLRLLKYEMGITLTMRQRGRNVPIEINGENQDTQNWDKLLLNVEWGEFKEKILLRLIMHGEYPICGISGRPIKEECQLSKDHQVCKSNGGSYRLSNLQPAMHEANGKRGNKKLGNSSPYLNCNTNGKIITNIRQIEERKDHKPKYRNKKKIRVFNLADEMINRASRKQR
ncbi:MAG: hypothetical protein FWG80_01215 [Alphaproteobacteria bacterium]|nr:hypothetical protein [Alphaproteobacteria bacterium]